METLPVAQCSYVFKLKTASCIGIFDLTRLCLLANIAHVETKRVSHILYNLILVWASNMPGICECVAAKLGIRVLPSTSLLFAL